MSLISPTSAFVVIAASLIAATTDIWRFKVYNALTGPLVLSGLVYHGATMGWVGLANSAMGLLFGFAILLLFYAMGGMGAGDVKLMAGIGAWIGTTPTLYVFIASALAGGVYAVALLVLAGGLHEATIHLQILLLRVTAFGRSLGSDARVESELTRDDRRRRLIPFAAMVAVGVIATFAWLRILPMR